MRPVSELLSDMSVRAKSVEDSAAAARTETREQLDARIAKAKSDAQRHIDAAKVQATGAQQEVADQWATLQASVRTQLDDIHRGIDERREEHDAKVALRRADRAESNAVAAIEFALAAIDEADQSVLAAIDARLLADSLN